MQILYRHQYLQNCEYDDSPYTSTLSRRYYKDGSEILIEQEDKNPRKITPRESARLQGFPDNYIIPVSDTQAYKQFGNAVNVEVVKRCAKKLFNYNDYSSLDHSIAVALIIACVFFPDLIFGMFM